MLRWWGAGQPRADRKGSALPLVTADAPLPLLCCAPVYFMKDEQVSVLPRVLSSASEVGMVSSRSSLTSELSYSPACPPSWRRPWLQQPELGLPPA